MDFSGGKGGQEQPVYQSGAMAHAELYSKINDAGSFILQWGNQSRIETSYEWWCILKMEKKHLHLNIHPPHNRWSFGDINMPPMHY